MKIKIHLNLFLLVGFIAISLLLSGCGKEKKPPPAAERIIVAQLQQPKTILYYNGILDPIRTIPVTSPVNGHVAEIKFKYGEAIKKDQVLVVINSPELAQNFSKSVTDYLQKKEAYEDGISSFRGSQALYNAGVTSKENFLSAKSNYENAVLSYFQSRFELEKVLKLANVPSHEIFKLQLGDTAAINRILQMKFTDIHVSAPGGGVALFPVAPAGGGGTTSGNSHQGKLTVGTQLKQGERLLSIGDLSGLSINIEVSEINVNRIKVGMPAIITGDAFPGITLHGEVIAVASQANPSSASSSTVSMFDVSILVPKMSEQQQEIIHVGMTSKVTLTIKDSPQIMLPIQAVQKKADGTSFVTLVTPNGQRQTRTVITGLTTPQGEVAIVSGIKSGDRVVMHD